MELVWLGDITLFGPELYTAQITKIRTLQWELRIRSQIWLVHVNRFFLTKTGAKRAARKLVQDYQTQANQHWHNQWKVQTNKVRYYQPDNYLGKLEYYMVYDPLNM